MAKARGEKSDDAGGWKGICPTADDEKKSETTSHAPSARAGNCLDGDNEKRKSKREREREREREKKEKKVAA